MYASLKGKSVIVTGGSKGIGKGIARVFAGHGAKALIVARQLKDAEAAAQELSGSGATVGAFAADVTNLADMEAMAKAAVDRNGGLDVLCANAGVFPQAKIEEMSPESWDDVMNTNLKDTFLAIKACVPHLKNGRVPRVQGSGLYHRPDHHRRWRASPAGIAGGVGLRVRRYAFAGNKLLWAGLVVLQACT